MICFHSIGDCHSLAHYPKEISPDPRILYAFNPAILNRISNGRERWSNKNRFQFRVDDTKVRNRESIVQNCPLKSGFRNAVEPCDPDLEIGQT